MRIVIPVINTIRPLAIGASTNALSDRGVTYDLNGNILSLTRYGADTAVPEEALAYSYNGNMLAGVSPYAYCLGNPISLFDPNGTDVWTVDALGNVVWKEQSDTHCLYYVDNDGNLSEDYVTVSDRSILDDLTKTEVKTDGGAEVSSHSSKTGINDMFKVFKFASDNTKVEWAIHRNGDSYTIGTRHKTDKAASWEDYVGAMPNATVHSHPEINAIVSEETYSMGYGATVRNNDQNNFKLDVKKYGIAARKNYVYFPNSGRLYKVGYNNAIFIKNVVSYKSFYFGVLNKK